MTFLLPSAVALAAIAALIYMRRDRNSWHSSALDAEAEVEFLTKQRDGAFAEVAIQTVANRALVKALEVANKRARRAEGAMTN